MRQGVCALLEKTEHKVTAQAGNGFEAVKMAKESTPEMVLMDVCMPRLNGIEATKRIIEENNDIKVIGFSEYVQKPLVIRMLKAGAMGYLLKSCVFENLLSAISQVREGKYFLSPEISDFVFDDYIGGSKSDNGTAARSLTERECRIIQMISEGKTNKQIAMELELNPKTTDACKRRIMDKLGIFTIAELTRFAIRQGLTPLEV
jgi:DNA-binding NarL/FixJ family response regulator